MEQSDSKPISLVKVLNQITNLLFSEWKLDILSSEMNGNRFAHFLDNFGYNLTGIPESISCLAYSTFVTQVIKGDCHLFHDIDCRSHNCVFSFDMWLSSSANEYRESLLILKFSFHSSGTTLSLTKLSHYALVRPGLIQNLRGLAGRPLSCLTAAVFDTDSESSLIIPSRLLV